MSENVVFRTDPVQLAINAGVGFGICPSGNREFRLCTGRSGLDSVLNARVFMRDLKANRRVRLIFDYKMAALG